MTTDQMEYDWKFDSENGTRKIDVLKDTGATNALVEKVLQDSAGDAPAIPIPGDCAVSLSGGIVRNGETHHTAVVRELTGQDEEQLAAVRSNPLKFLEKLLVLGTQEIGGEPVTPAVAGELLVGDRDALILGIRKVTFGDKLEAQEVVCPTCDLRFDVRIHLDTVPVTPMASWEFTVPLRHGAEALVRWPNGDDQGAMLADPRASNAEQNTILLSRCVLKVAKADGTVSSSGEKLAKELGIADRREILRRVTADQPGPKLLDISVEHEDCGTEVPLPVTTADLFRSF